MPCGTGDGLAPREASRWVTSTAGGHVCLMGPDGTDRHRQARLVQRRFARSGGKPRNATAPVAPGLSLPWNGLGAGSLPEGIDLESHRHTSLPDAAQMTSSGGLNSQA